MSFFLSETLLSMPKKKYIVSLVDQERGSLQELIRKGLSHSFNRCYADFETQTNILIFPTSSRLIRISQ